MNDWYYNFNNLTQFWVIFRKDFSLTFDTFCKGSIVNTLNKYPTTTKTRQLFDIDKVSLNVDRMFLCSCTFLCSSVVVYRFSSNERNHHQCIGIPQFTFLKCCLFVNYYLNGNKVYTKKNKRWNFNLKSFLVHFYST